MTARTALSASCGNAAKIESACQVGKTLPPVTFTIHGKPYAKKRPRFSRKTGRAYDPAGNASFENTVAAVAVDHFDQPIDGPVKLTITAVFEPAKSWSKKKRNAAMGTSHTQKPDFDNLQKAICDGLNRIAWADDSQVAQASCVKRWGPIALTTVTVEPLTERA